MSNRDPFKKLLRLRRPCSNCPFRVSGAIELAPGRLNGIIEYLLADDGLTFHCHKTLDADAQDQSDDDGAYRPTGAGGGMCAGAAALLMKRQRPNLQVERGYLVQSQSSVQRIL